MMARLFVYFIITAFVGYIYECIAMTVWSGRWDNRGFMFGPVIPIYGVGCLLGFLFFGNIIKEYAVWQVFLAGFLGSAILEYPTSLIMEKIFHTRWWDYSVGPWNIDGRVSLLSSLGFGLGAVIIVYVINPLLVPLVWSLDQPFVNAAAIILAILFWGDFAASVYCSAKHIEPAFYTNINNCLYSFTEKINPQQHSLYKLLKEKTGLFK